MIKSLFTDSVNFKPQLIVIFNKARDSARFSIVSQSLTIELNVQSHDKHNLKKTN